MSQVGVKANVTDGTFLFVAINDSVFHVCLLGY